MDPYAISRRNGWPAAGEFATPGARSARVLNDDLPEDVRWIRSYVLNEGDGAVRTLCIYEAPSLEAIREHASRAGLPADKIIPIAETCRPPLGLPQYRRALTSGPGSSGAPGGPAPGRLPSTLGTIEPAIGRGLAP